MCSPQIPHPSGQAAAPSTGLENPLPSPKYHSSMRRYIPASEKTMSLNVPWEGQLFLIQTWPSSADRVAGTVARHSGHRERVDFGREVTTRGTFFPPSVTP